MGQGTVVRVASKYIDVSFAKIDFPNDIRTYNKEGIPVNYRERTLFFTPPNIIPGATISPLTFKKGDIVQIQNKKTDKRFFGEITEIDFDTLTIIGWDEIRLKIHFSEYEVTKLIPDESSS